MLSTEYKIKHDQFKPQLSLKLLSVVTIAKNKGVLIIYDQGIRVDDVGRGWELSFKDTYYTSSPKYIYISIDISIKNPHRALCTLVPQGT